MKKTFFLIFFFLSLCLICFFVIKYQQSKKEQIILSQFIQQHSNIYKAYTTSNSNEIYNILSKSFTGPLLEQKYLEFTASLKKRLEDKVSIIIDDIEYINIKINHHKQNNIDLTARWSVCGRLKHNQHTHMRYMIYTAEYSLKKQNNTYKIIGTQLHKTQDFQLKDSEKEQNNNS